MMGNILLGMACVFLIAILGFLVEAVCELKSIREILEGTEEETDERPASDG